MRLKYTNLPLALAAFALIFTFAVSPAFAQEGEVRVIDEVVAQVNNDVITLSMIKREMKEGLAALQQQGKTEQEATEEINRRQPELIASLIIEQLLLQQGKELGLTDEVEAEINRRMIDVAKAQGIKTIEGLKAAMSNSGYDYEGVRTTMRSEMMKQAVLSRDVDAKLFYGFSNKELQDYFNAHKDKFKKAESLTLSEIFLSLAGKPEAEVKAKAQQLVAQARAGGDFAALAVANSERLQDGVPVAPKTKGLVGTFEITNLRDKIAEAVKDVKAGGVSEPIVYDEGYQILRVDERIAGSETPTFNDARVREAMTSERSAKARADYMEKLRKDAFIKISESYRAAVTPFLIASGTPPAAPASTAKP